MFNIKERAERMPVGVLATALGAATLSNVYAGLGFTYVKTIIILMAAVVFILGIIKLTLHRKTFLKEYDNPILASLYGTFSMVAMVLGSALYPFSNSFGKGLWLFGIIFHACLIGVFTYRNVIKNFNIDKFAPSWFVTYNGIMVAVVVGGKMGMPILKKIILYYGILVFFTIIPFMVKRLIEKPLPDAIYHVKTVLLAPSSLCVVCYLALTESPNFFFVSLLYIIVFITLLAVLKSIPKFFSFEFHPGFAGTTFPMAIGVVASLKVAGYLQGLDMTALSVIVKNIAGIQIFITTGIISFVYFNFLKKAFRK